MSVFVRNKRKSITILLLYVRYQGHRVHMVLLRIYGCESEEVEAIPTIKATKAADKNDRLMEARRTNDH